MKEIPPSILRRTNFVQWLNKRGKNEIAGHRCASMFCPLAHYLADKALVSRHIKKPEMFRIETAAHPDDLLIFVYDRTGNLFDLPTVYRLRTPKWAQKFIDSVDELPTSNFTVTVRQCLNIMRNKR